MPDDDRTRRRLGDETKGRIADLASGWTVDGEKSDSKPADSAPDKPAEGDAPRQKAKTVPPPPPGSQARRVLEDAIVDSNTPIPIATPRTKPPTAPPRAGTKTGAAAVVPPTVKAFAKSGPTETGTVERSGVIGQTGPTPKSSTPVIERGEIATKKPSATTIKSGPTATGTVERSGLIGAEPSGPSGVPAPIATPAGASGPIPRASGSSSGPVPGASGSIPIADRSGSILHSAPIAAKPDPEKAGHRPESAKAKPVPPPRGGARPAPPPPPGAPGSKVGSTTGTTGAIGSTAERLPLRPDTTDVSAPPSAVPPPVPPPRARSTVVPNDESAETIVEDQPGALPRLTVPVGEFEAAGTQIEEAKLRIAYEQSTIKRDPANAVLGLAEPSQTVVKAPPVGVLLEETAQQLMRGDPTSVDAPATAKFERGDPTLGQGDPTMTSAPSDRPAAAGTLRSTSALRRKRGAGGDLRYVATVLFGVRRARQELDTLERRQELRQESRRRHLITLGRAAASIDGFDHPALGPARDNLAGVEDERSQHAGAVAAADSELTRVQRDREAKAKQCAEDIIACDTEIAEIAKKLEPLEKETIGVARRAGELRDSLRRIDQQIAATEQSQHSLGKKTELSAIQAEIATLKADRVAVQRDEPKIAAELDALNPRIAALEARRADARKRRTELEQSEVDDQRRTEELLAAIGAKRKVVDRAAGDAETLRDKILFELGERLYVDRPRDLSGQLAPIDVIDVELGTGDRRMMELREIISSVDKPKLWRGIALATLIFLFVAGTAAALIYLTLLS